MANVLHRITKQYLISVNTPEYDSATWIINPDLSAVANLAVNYWKITGDIVDVMSEAERADADRVQPFAGLDLVASIALKNDMVNKHRERIMENGWTYEGVRYDSNEQARQNMTGTMTLISTGYALPSNFVWRALDNTNHPFDNATFTSFYRASCLWMETLYHTSWYHKGQIAALTSPAEVAAYDFSAGWPN